MRLMGQQLRKRSIRGLLAMLDNRCLVLIDVSEVGALAVAWLLPSSSDCDKIRVSSSFDET